ncbi:hypothetical protein SS1G_05759 [Sclerotinia sclerotiorum 1980 UF-70]|uniref:Smr domain-containing protein n=2 Tax=Sclerotinia sclerotiorum (strain ATCC 18683 / 1980 / Ss-1) TaxID=665079 RepID=A7EKB2_SCLS1|nr:hypothetical protein SS1G_05759 [Sclerotinia sclerotiorum 1980 UF-70]APA09976.1 hypothetical protein sscle_05g047460 [Sclerotinia sclerotiorum 1980 UF-70]EDO03278.1 hypothetical protein SS1G_05759 [Sclerotinia sclerotiorum 1980 UF-70]
MSSSYAMKSMGPKAFNHSSSNDAEAEYDRLRDLAHKEAAKRSQCFDQAHQAYTSGDGARAHDLSAEGKKHAAQMDAYNRQASDYIFRENNAPGRVGDDEIDLHGQYVEEAERIVEERIKYARQQGQSHLHVIVGKGNHSKDHVQKIKPKVEEVCRELGLQYATEENAGRMYINLQGGAAVMPPSGGSHGESHGGQHHGGQQQGGYQQPSYQQPQQGYQQPQQSVYQQGGQQQEQQQQQDNNNDELEKLARKFLPRILQKAEKACCAIM